MAAQAGVPLYMEQLLDELGWNQGTRIPLANEDNQILENLLISKQNEVQRLKEAVILQNQKQADLSKYKGNVQTEYQENTRLLFALKQQLEQEVKLRQMSHTEADRLEHGIHEYSKQSQEICTRVDRLQQSIARLLKKADSMKIEVCGERGALQEWRAALDRNACDIDAIKQFTKQDTSKIKALETKRQKLKIEHDRGQQHLNQLVSDLDAEERACERISLQVREGMSQRQDMMKMWTNAVDNLRQRDVDIRHIKEDYEELTAEATQIAEKMREQQGFFEQQSANNQEAEKENAVLNQKLGQMRMAVQDMAAANITLESEDQSLRRELSNMRRILENLHMEGRNIKEMKHRRELNIRDLNDKIRMLKQKLIESMDKSKSAEKRAKELEEILNEEEKFASQLTLNQQRAMHCSFVEQQKLLALRTEDKLFHMKLRASKAVMGKLLSKQAQFEKVLQAQKEGLYCICFQAETLGARVAHMEGAQAEREVSAELVNKENRLKDVYARHAGRVALLERHSARLHDDMRRLARDIEVKGFDHTKLVSNLKTAMLEVDGCNKDLRNLRDLWRKDRVEEALMKLKVAHATRAVTGLDDTAFSLDKQRLQLDAAMNERLVEIAARRDLFAVQRRALFEDCGKLHSEIREREQRIEQLIKRYDIFIASLGKDDSGQQLSVTFFKIKFAAERAELRERGACLDKDISRREADVSALEAALRVLHAAHKHFLHHISPLADDTPEMTEIHELTEKYYKMCDALKTVKPEIEKLQQKVAEQKTSHEEAARLHQMLVKRQSEAEMDLEEAQDRVTKQEVKLNNAREVVKHHAKRAKKLIHGVDEWRIFQLAIWVHDYAEAAQRAMQGLVDTCSGYPDLYKHFGALIALTDIARYITRPQKALGTIMSKLITESAQPISEVGVTIDRTGKGSVFSSSTESVHSGVSLASGYTRRLAAFRRQLSVKVNEPALNEEVIQLARRSTVSLRVVTLGLEDMPASTANLSVSSQSKFFR